MTDDVVPFAACRQRWADVKFDDCNSRDCSYLVCNEMQCSRVRDIMRFVKSIFFDDCATAVYVVDKMFHSQG